MIRVPPIGIRPTTVSTACLYLLYLRLFPPIEASLTFIDISKENILYVPGHRQVPCCMKINPARFVLAQL